MEIENHSFSPTLGLIGCAASLQDDTGSIPAPLLRHLAQLRGGGRVLIPGCRKGNEMYAFAAKGFDVVVINFSETAVANTKEESGSSRIFAAFGDFFSQHFEFESFDIIYEHGFLSSLPRSMWSDYASRVTSLLRARGRLIGFFRYGETKDGLTSYLAPGELGSLFGLGFENAGESTVHSPDPDIEGREYFEVWLRKPSSITAQRNFSSM